jgi:PAS domain S-box-containing protein
MQVNIEELKIYQPFISGFTVLVLIALIIFSIYFGENNKTWILFLSGILVMAVIAEAANISNTERVVIRRGKQLINVKSKLSHETQLREKAEDEIAASKSRLILIDEELPIMVALIDSGGMCQYYNQAFMEWLHLQSQQIIGRNIRLVLGAKIFREVATAIRQSLNGHPVHYERIQKMPDGRDHRLFIEHIPRFSENGEVTGFYMLVNDITSPGNANVSGQLESNKIQVSPVNDLDMRDNAQDVKTSQDRIVADPFSKQTTENDNNTRGILNAIENGEYCVFRQLITSIAEDSTKIEHYEILIRLMGAENKILLPGEFFPLAEMNSRMLYLDRWVVDHILEYTSRHNLLDKGRKSSMFFINVSDDTISDASFPEFLRTALREHDVPGTALCFEIPAIGLILRNQEITKFAQQVKKCDCRIAISGFGQDPVLFDLIQGFKVDFLKIDGGIIRNILRDPVDLTAVRIINRTAKEIGVETIAESVENEETVIKLGKIGIHFAQGHGISRPRPLVEKSPKPHQKNKAA